MKIRTGFVSNSSSSSFVVNAKSTMEVCKKMIDVVKQEYISEDLEWWKKYHDANVNKFLKKYPDDYNGGIRIPFTCNFDTYIFPVKDGKCYIETCNNHEWREAFPSMSECEDYGNKHSESKIRFVNVSPFKKCAEIEVTPEQKMYNDFETEIKDRIDKIDKNPDSIKEIKTTSKQDAYIKGLKRGCELGLKVAKKTILKED